MQSLTCLWHITVISIQWGAGAKRFTWPIRGLPIPPRTRILHSKHQGHLFACLFVSCWRSLEELVSLRFPKWPEVQTPIPHYCLEQHTTDTQRVGITCCKVRIISGVVNKYICCLKQRWSQMWSGSVYMYRYVYCRDEHSPTPMFKVSQINVSQVKVV